MSTPPTAPGHLRAGAEVTVVAGPDGAWQRTTVDQSFLGASLLGEGRGSTELVLHQTLTRRDRAGLDGDDVRLETTAYPGQGPEALARRLWTATDHADSGRVVDGSFYVATLLDRGPGDSLDRYRDLATGRFLFAASGPPLLLDRRHFERARLVAYWSGTTPERHPCHADGDLGWLTVLGRDGSTRQVVIASRERVPPFHPDWGIVDPRDGQVKSRFPSLVKPPFPLPAELRLTFDGAEAPQVRLPLADGDVDPDRAVLAPGFRVERRACPSQEPRPWR